jgi:site-specific recombinase XerD
MTILPQPSPHDGLGVGGLEDKAADYIARAKSANTLRAYRSDWRAFSAWCLAHQRTALPADADTLVLYLSDEADRLKTATLRRHLSSIAVAHQAARAADPTKDGRVQATWAGVRRVHGVAQRGKEALLTDQLRAMVNGLPDTMVGIRDRSLLLLGFSAALRRSELVALDVGDVGIVPEGLVLEVRRSKTDQEAAGRQIGVPSGKHIETCPVAATEAWLAVARFDDGPMFRPIDRHGNVAATRLSAKAVALVIKRAAERAGLDPKRFAGHSLRSGLATSAAKAGATETEIMNQTGHRSVAVLRRYVRRGSLFEDNAASRLGL